MIDLPMGVRVGFKVYLTSEAEGLDSVISVDGAKSVTEENLAPLVEASIKTSNEISGLDDFRAMTDDEITEYLEDEEEDEGDDHDDYE